MEKVKEFINEVIWCGRKADKRKINIKRILLVALKVIAFVVLMLLFYHCPLMYFFNIPCPGCGMTRAYLSLLRFDFAAAYEYHSLFPIPAIVFAYYLIRKRLRLNDKLETGILIFLISLFFIRWIFILCELFI